MARITYIPNRVIDTNGISDGAAIDVFQTGTTTRVSLFSDEGLITPLTNPVVVAAGAAVPALYHGESGNVRVRVVDSGGAVVSDDDPFNAPVGEVDLASSASAKGAGLVGTTYGTTVAAELAKGVLLSRYADRTGATDAAAGIASAIAAAVPTLGFATPKKVIRVDRGEYSIQSEVDLSGENVLFVGAGGVIKPDRTLGGNIFKSTSGILEFDGVEFDGGSSQSSTATSTTYIMLVGNSASFMERVRVENCRFKNCDASDGQALGTAAAKVTHAVYADGVTDLIVRNNSFETISGAALFTKDVTNLQAVGNTVLNAEWYNFNIDYNTSGVISGNRFDHTLATGIYWGGAINTVNNQGLVRNHDLVIEKNTFSGKYSYGAVIRIQSDDGITIQDNTFLQCDTGSLSAGNLVGIGVTTRNPDGSTPSDPPRDVKILRNRGLTGFAGGTYRALIYVNNDMFGGRNPIEGLEISGNFCDSPTATEYFTGLALVHGLIGGVTDVSITENVGSVYLKTANPVPGGIGLIGTDANGLVDRVNIGGNSITNLETPVGSTQVGIQVDAQVDRVRSTKPNYIGGCHFGIRTISGTGPTLENLDDQRYGTNTTDAVFSQSLTRYAKPLYGSKTYDPPSLGAGATTFTDVTVTGAALGDHVEASFSLDNAGVIFTGYVRVASSVRVYLENKTGGVVDLASGTLTVTVHKLGSS